MGREAVGAEGKLEVFFGLVDVWTLLSSRKSSQSTIMMSNSQSQKFMPIVISCCLWHSGVRVCGWQCPRIVFPLLCGSNKSLFRDSRSWLGSFTFPPGRSAQNDLWALFRDPPVPGKRVSGQFLLPTFTYQESQLHCGLHKVLLLWCLLCRDKALAN